MAEEEMQLTRMDEGAYIKHQPSNSRLGRSPSLLSIIQSLFLILKLAFAPHCIPNVSTVPCFFFAFSLSIAIVAKIYFSLLTPFSLPRRLMPCATIVLWSGSHSKARTVFFSSTGGWNGHKWRKQRAQGEHVACGGGWESEGLTFTFTRDSLMSSWQGCPSLPSLGSLFIHMHMAPLVIWSSFLSSSPSGLSWYCVTTRVPISCFNGIKGKSNNPSQWVNEWLAKAPEIERPGRIRKGPWDASHMDSLIKWILSWVAYSLLQ